MGGAPFRRSPVFGSAMDAYFVIIHLPDQPVAEIMVLKAETDPAARSEAQALAEEWPLFARIELYRGERKVAVIEAREPIAA